jgi:hypothetical protein
MAHRITYKPQGIILSSAVGEITVAVDGDFVDVSLTATGGIVILSERYYAHGGYVTLYDLGSLIESEMNKSGQSCADFTLRVFTGSVNNKADSWVLHILYCDRFTVCTDISAFLRENFLTTLSVRRHDAFPFLLRRTGGEHRLFRRPFVPQGGLGGSLSALIYHRQR